MLIALTEAGEKEYATPGATGSCPVCNGDVLAVCGSEKIWHWRHRSLSDCDAWHENEGPWHRDWKALFPKPYLEVVVGAPADSSLKDGFGPLGKHRADIKLPNGLVIELQSSPLSVEAVSERELFYGNMLWIFDMRSRQANRYSIFHHHQPQPLADYPLKNPFEKIVGTTSTQPIDTQWEAFCREVPESSERWAHFRKPTTASVALRHGYTNLSFDIRLPTYMIEVKRPQYWDIGAKDCILKINTLTSTMRSSKTIRQVQATILAKSALLEQLLSCMDQEP